MMDENEKTLLEAFDKQAERESLPEYVARARGHLVVGGAAASREEVIEALKTVSDPEIMINIYDLGLVYGIEISPEGNVDIAMTVTSPLCPVAGILPQQAADAVADLAVAGVEVKIVWEPAWGIERLSDDAKAMLELV